MSSLKGHTTTPPAHHVSMTPDQVREQSTPRPLIITQRENGRSWIEVIDARHGGRMYTAKEAESILSAYPDLLESLRIAGAALFDRSHGKTANGGDCGCHDCEALGFVNAAIAKASAS